MTPFVLLILAGLGPLVIALGAAEKAPRDPPPAPTFADLRYGPHPRNRFDLWLPKSSRPTPLVLQIHGGGFRAGDKGNFRGTVTREYLAAGWAVAAINYRLTDTAPAPAAYLDCARALQHIRHHAREWNIDSTLVASTGGSAGAGTSLWLAFHDDLADPKSPDPIARQSTRLTCVAVGNPQSSYDPRFAERIGIPRPNFERHEFFLPFYGITKDEIDTPKAYALYAAAAPITYLTKDDPPVLLKYSYANEPITARSSVGLMVHHPLLGIALKREMDRLGIECVVQHLRAPNEELMQDPAPAKGGPISMFDFIQKHFAGANRSSPASAGNL